MVPSACRHRLGLVHNKFPQYNSPTDLLSLTSTLGLHSQECSILVSPPDCLRLQTERVVLRITVVHIDTTACLVRSVCTEDPMPRFLLRLQGTDTGGVNQIISGVQCHCELTHPLLLITPSTVQKSIEAFTLRSCWKFPAKESLESQERLALFVEQANNALLSQHFLRQF